MATLFSLGDMMRENESPWTLDKAGLAAALGADTFEDETAPIDIRVFVFNHKRGGRNDETGKYDFSGFIEALEGREPPHIICAPECTGFLDDGHAGLYQFLSELDGLWAGTNHYRHWVSPVPGSMNIPGLFMTANEITPRRWWLHGGHRVRTIKENVVEATIGGMTFVVKPIHWNGSGGEASFKIQSAYACGLSESPALLLGDFNLPPSSAAGTFADDWGRHCDDIGRPLLKVLKGRWDGTKYVVNTAPVDQLRDVGFWNVAELAGMAEVTTVVERPRSAGLPIDMIFGSSSLPARPVKDTFFIVTPDAGKEKSDHKAFGVTLRFHPNLAGSPARQVLPRRDSHVDH